MMNVPSLRRTTFTERTAIMIDGPNLFASAKHLKIDINYESILRHFGGSYLVRAYYYTAVDESSEYVAIRPLLDWLMHNGYTVKTKPTKSFRDDRGREKVKGNMDVEITVDMLTISQTISHLVLFSGDGDFRYVVEKVQETGVRVTVVSLHDHETPMIAGELRAQADVFVDLKALVGKIARTRER
jgi:uncharacterized LabA/DUF88 family protein